MAAENTRAEGLGPVAILVILALGASLSLVVWQGASREGDAELELQTQGYASALKDVLTEEVDRLIAVVRRRAQSWGTPAFSADSAVWRESAEILLAENPSILAVMRGGLLTEVAGAQEGQRILAEVLPEVTQRTGHASGEFLLGPLHADGDRSVLVLQVQPAADGSHVLALVDLRRVVGNLFEKRALGFALRLSAGGRELYRSVPAEGVARNALRREETVPLRGGEPWLLEVTPVGEGPVARWEQGPAIALATGLLASGLIAAAVHFGTLSWRRDRMLRRINTALEQQIRDTRRGEGELRELSAALEQRVAQRTRELNETIVELETFNYSVSHDLRGQLGAVINFAAILEEDYAERLDGPARDYLQRIVKSATSAVSMMDALLAFSRSGRAEIHKVHLDMKRVANEVVEEVTVQIPDMKCSVTVGDLPSVYADENMMRLVFTNLLRNACKFAQKGEGPQVEIGGERGSDEMIYYVRDRGIGFDMRYADKLFTVFQRLHASEGYEGHGVGLAIVARIVRRHGGRCWAQGAVDKGATFYFTVANNGAEDGRPAH
jgi:signal transduction histidine kinase